MLGFVFLLSLSLSVTATPGIITNAVQWKATNGEVIHAHGGGVIKVGSVFYWFGENRNADSTFRYVTAYRSTDLVTWDFAHNVLSQSSAGELARCNIERPKVIYNPATGNYVLWMHWENGSNYTAARTAVAISSTVDGDYTYIGSFRPLDNDSRDMTVYVDDDGTGYLISATAVNADLNIYKLDQEFTAIDSLVTTLWKGSYREAPAMFKRNGVYWLLTSGATNWDPNQQKYATAPSVAGPWTTPTNIGNSFAYGSQTAYVVLVGNSALYLGDRWAGSWKAPVRNSTYVWLPLLFPSDTSMTMSWTPKLTIDIIAGTLTPVSAGVGSTAPYHLLKPRHAGGAQCLDVPGTSYENQKALTQYSCNSGTNQQFELFQIESDFYYIKPRHSGMCLSTSSTNTIVQTYCNEDDLAQQWRVTVSSGYATIATRASGECLDVSGASTANSAAVLKYNCTSAQNQQWQIVDS
ncbi:putative beta-xylosidase, secreted [Cladochytrium replicatum]|nr:putative beta-xylosidase, secreted [Cladochytrium replicatum]